MNSVLLINHHSLIEGKYVSETFNQGKLILNQFFKTWAATVESGYFERHIVCDAPHCDLWNWQPSENKTMWNYFDSLDPNDRPFVARALDHVVKKDFSAAYDEIVSHVLSQSPLVGDEEYPLLGVAACIGDAAPLLSLATDAVWSADNITISWKPSTSGDAPKCDTHCINLATVEQVVAYCNTLAQRNPITREAFSQMLPSVNPSDEFMDWFLIADKRVQHAIVDKAKFCAEGGWLIRENSPFAPVRGSNPYFSELRVWHPLIQTLRVYAKKYSENNVRFISVSDKDSQDIAIKKANKYLRAYEAGRDS